MRYVRRCTIHSREDRHGAAYRCNRSGSRHCRHIGRAAARQARALGCADRPARAGRRNELRQHRRDRRRQRVSDRVSAQPQEAHSGRAQACARSELPLGRSAQDRALARLLLPLLVAGEPEGQRGQAAAADEPRGRRARRAAAGIRRDEILSQDRLDHALSQRCRLRGDEAAARVRRGDRCRGAAARHRRDAQARAEPQSGVPPFAVLAGCRLALQSVDGDACLCGAAHGAWRRGDQGRCAFAASRRRQVAGRYR